MKKSLGMVISHLQGGGAQRVASTLSFQLIEKYDLSLILHDGRKISYQYSGQVIDLKTPVTGNPLLRILNFMIRTIKLKRYKNQYRPQAVISFMEGANFINILSGKTCRVIISVRNYKSKQKSGFIGLIFSLLIKFLYGKSYLIVAASEGIKADLVSNFGLPFKTIKVIYNPLDLEFIAGKSKKALEPQEKVFFGQGEVLVTAGRLSRQKGQWHLLRAFAEVKKSRPGVKLVILGDGELREMLGNLVEDLQLVNAVLLAGFRENPFKYVSKADLFVLPSLYEGFPNVLVEAMACKTAVLATDCPSGPREILAPASDFNYVAYDLEEAEYGVLLPCFSGKITGANEPLSREEKIMAGAILKMLDNQELRNKYAREGLRRIRDFASAGIAERWVEVIEG